MEELVIKSWTEDLSHTTACEGTGSHSSSEDPQIIAVLKQDTVSESNRNNVPLACSGAVGDDCDDDDGQYSGHSFTTGLPAVLAFNTSPSLNVRQECEGKGDTSPALIQIETGSAASGDCILQYLQLSPSPLSSDVPDIMEQIASQVTDRNQTLSKASPEQIEEQTCSNSKDSVYSLSPGMVEAVACSSILDDSEPVYGAAGGTFSNHMTNQMTTNDASLLHSVLTEEVVTPAAKARPREFMLDVAVTPMPEYRSIATPLLKVSY